MRWFPSRLSSLCAFPLSFRANWKCQNGVVFWCSSSFFSLSRKREKRRCRLEKSTRARLVGEREMRPKRARKKDAVASRTFSFERIRCAQKEFLCVCSRTKVVESRKARARLAQNFVWRLFPLEKKKNILAFAPFFSLFFSFLGSFSSLFWQKMAVKKRARTKTRSTQSRCPTARSTERPAIPLWRNVARAIIPSSLRSRLEVKDRANCS